MFGFRKKIQVEDLIIDGNKNAKEIFEYLKEKGRNPHIDCAIAGYGPMGFESRDKEVISYTIFFQSDNPWAKPSWLSKRFDRNCDWLNSPRRKEMFYF